jgi:DNA-directed RNA polymerase subunit beta
MRGISSQFPIENNRYRITVSNLRALKKEYSLDDQKAAILQSKSLTYPIKGDLELTDLSTGTVVDTEKDFTLMDSFYLTGKHTLIYSGNNYMVSNQLQLRPGAYTRTKDSTGDIETHFNTGTGRSFTISLDPKTTLFRLNVASSSIPLAPLLTHVFGIDSTTIDKYVPREVWEANVIAVSGKEKNLISSFYQRLVSTAKQIPSADTTQMIQQLRESLEGSELSEQTTSATLGKPFKSVTSEAILISLRNIIKVYKNEQPEDRRDSLQFKRVQNLPDFLRTRFEKNHESVTAIKRKLKFNLERIDPKNPKIRQAVPAKPYSKIYSSYIVNSPLVTTPTETNPIESLENVAKVTVLGEDEGGISSERAVPMSARNIDPSHLGILDPSRTPESSHAGIDQRFTFSARRDREGNLYSKVTDKTGKEVAISVTTLMNSVVAFPHQEGKKIVQVQDHGVMKEVSKDKVDYWITDATDMYTVTTNLVPFLNSNHPGRLTMAGKAIPQALSLVNRERPLVQTVDKRGVPFVNTLAKLISEKSISPVDGIVSKITDSAIHIKDGDGNIHKVTKTVNLPYNMKGFMDDEAPLVSEGNKVTKHQVLYENNYTKGGDLALGKNLSVAYLPWKGYNMEDAIVIRHGAAKDMTSHHAFKFNYEVTPESLLKKSLISKYFPGRLTREQLDKLDEKGFAKVGVELLLGDPVYAVLEKREPTVEDKLLGRLHKSLINPYRLVIENWSEELPGKVVDAHTDGKYVRLLARGIKELGLGDKLTGLHGNKGVVSLIVPDHEMPYDKETGKPVDLILNPASVTSRINLGQLMESVAGKIAEKTGKPYSVKNFAVTNNLKTLQGELKQHGLSDTATLVNPVDKNEYGNVLTGKQYILKLFKTTEQNYSARNVGGYDNIMQPTKGGEEGSKGVGPMEFLGLLGSNARKNLKEMGTIKSEENSEFWSKFMLGQPLPKPKTTFATQKFMDYLHGAGVKVNIEGGQIRAKPLTDHDILSMSEGHLKEPLMLNSKNLEPESGGLFDQTITGGIKGQRWSHYKLAEPIINPVGEKPVKSLLGLSTKEFEAITNGKYGVKKIDAKHFELINLEDGIKVRDIKL